MENEKKVTLIGGGGGGFLGLSWSVSYTSQTYIPRVLELWSCLGVRAGVRFWFIVEIFLLSPFARGAGDAEYENLLT